MIRAFAILCICSLAACAPRPESVEIPFEVLIDGRPASCTDVDRDLRLTDLRFYIHALRFIGPDGDLIPIDLVPDDTWQNRDVAFIDLESGEGDCLNGSAAMNTVARGTYSGEPVQGLTFEIGVPETLNHRDPLLAEAPLGYSEMHWHWVSGYKFLRAGVTTDSDSYFLHLGSSRCAGTIGNIEGCRAANRPLVRLEHFRPGRDRVVIDLTALFASVDLQDGIRTDCQSGPANADCIGVFWKLGLAFETGQPVAPAAVFGTGSGP